VRDHAPVIYKAADVIGGLPADHIRSFIKGWRVIAHGHSRQTSFDSLL
jgi:hypothetical protein